jgi:ABC-type sugar transport system permease subunit
MYPVSYEADYQSEQNRATTFFRLILAIPWFIVAIVYYIVASFSHLFAWVAVVILGRYPEGLYNFNSGMVRFFIRTSAWVYLQTDEWPPFGLADDRQYPIRVNIAPRAEQQSRLKAFFRIILVLPMLIVSYAVSYAHQWIAVIAWLTIVFRGYLPEQLNTAMTFCNSFYARTYGYIALLTDDYPPIAAEKAKSVGNLGGGPAMPPPASPTV